MRFALLSAVAACFFTTACSTTSGGMPYKASTRNVISIQDWAGDSKAQVKLSDFTAGADVSSTMWCRANGPVTIGAGVTPAQFIHDALQEELFMARVYSNNAPIVISGRLDALSFSSVAPANWEIALTLSSSTGASYQTTIKHGFDSSWNAGHACKNVGDAFAPAVQTLLGKATADARFKSLLVP